MPSRLHNCVGGERKKKGREEGEEKRGESPLHAGLSCIRGYRGIKKKRERKGKKRGLCGDFVVQTVGIVEDQ